jgi:hypothetical protein
MQNRRFEPRERWRAEWVARREREEADARREREEADSRREREEADARREREEAERSAHEHELDLIARAKAVKAEQKHQAEVAWARRILSEEEEPGGPLGRESIPKNVRHDVWRRDEGKCRECGSSERLEFDHVIPLAMGGANTERNLQLLCEACNRRKGKSLG